MFLKPKKMNKIPLEPENNRNAPETKKKLPK